MTDDQQWQAPDSVAPSRQPAPSGAPSAPANGPFGPPPGSYAPPSPGWTVPPKPGLVPLRPMTLGTILGASFQTLRRNPSATLAPALVLSLIVALIQALSSAGFLTKYLGAVSDLSTNSASGGPLQLSSQLTSSFLGFFLTSLASGVLSLFVTAIVQGIVTVQVASSTLGTRLRLGALWRRMRGRRGAIIGWAALSTVVSTLAIAVVAGLLVLIGLTGTVGVVIAVLLGVVLTAGLSVVAIWLWVKLGFVPQIIVLERAGIRRSMARSWALTRGAFWRTFGIRLLVVAMVSVAAQIIAGPISIAFSLGGTVLAPNGDTTAAATNALVLSTIITQAVTAVISAVGLVVVAATGALLYLDQRMRQEGLDLDLARYVEHRQAGMGDLADPYLRDAPAGVA